MDDKYFINEVNKKILGFKRTRLNRISASERLKKYSSRWNLLFLIMNSLAIFLVIVSIKAPMKSGIDVIISGCFSIYIILLQYFISNQNYRERSLKFHYEQLEIDKLRYDLKKLIYSQSSFDDRENEYGAIIDKYMISLKNNENHEKVDDEQNKYINDCHEKVDDVQETQKNKYFKNIIKKFDLTMDNMFIYFNVLLIICLVVLLVYLYG
ncbi:MAG: SLATT domain-containing protein [Lactobacillaceae bacterium]